MEISGGAFYLKFTIYRNPDFAPMEESHEQHVGDVGVEQQNVGVEQQNVGVEQQNIGVEKDNFTAVICLIQANPHTTAKELATLLHTTTRTAERILRQLKQSGKIRREGSGRYGHWVILEYHGCGERRPANLMQEMKIWILD